MVFVDSVRFSFAKNLVRITIKSFTRASSIKTVHFSDKTLSRSFFKLQFQLAWLMLCLISRTPAFHIATPVELKLKTWTKLGNFKYLCICRILSKIAGICILFVWFENSILSLYQLRSSLKTWFSAIFLLFNEIQSLIFTKFLFSSNLVDLILV